jgi:type IV pilus assembly protein PilA
MKKSCRKKKSKNSLKKILKGFTLVELLAVIVILAIVMIIAIPAVLETMENARKKTFSEYAMKVSTGAEKQYLEDKLVSNPGTCVLYNIKKDLGFSNTGNYDGYVVIKMTNNGYKIYLTLKDNNYMIYGVDGTNLENVELKRYVDGEYLSDVNLLSVAKCEKYSVVKKEVSKVYEEKTVTLIENPSSSSSTNDTPITKKLFTGEKKGNSGWVGVYDNGNMTGCYNSRGNVDYDTGKYLNDGSLESSYCTGTTQSILVDTCIMDKSIDCCTGAVAGESISPQDTRYYKYTYFMSKSNGEKAGRSSQTCGAFWFRTPSNSVVYSLSAFDGGGLQATGVYED